MKHLLLPSLLLVGLQACATDDTALPVETTTPTPTAGEPAESTITRLAMVDGASYRVGRDTGLVDADRILLSDGVVDLRVSDLLRGLDLSNVSHLDLTTRLDSDDRWHVDLAPGLVATRQARSFCAEWVTVVTYKADGTMKIDIVCMQEVWI